MGRKVDDTPEVYDNGKPPNYETVAEREKVVLSLEGSLGSPLKLILGIGNNNRRSIISCFR